MSICYNFLLFGYPINDKNTKNFYRSTYKLCATNSKENIPNRDVSRWDASERQWLLKSALIASEVLNYLVNYELSRKADDSYLQDLDLSEIANVRRMLSYQTGMYFVEYTM